VDGSQINWFTNKQLESVSLMLQGLAAILFCYVSHQMLFPLVGSLKRPSRGRFNKIINRVHAAELISYFLVGITAYLLLLNDKIDPVVISSIPTGVMTFGKILMLASLFIAVPLNMYPGRESLFEAFQI
jgi:amino acid permease